MKHAGPKALDRLEPFLAELRRFEGLKEKSRGCFYLRGRGFLHFHEHGEDELYADIGLGAETERIPAMTIAQRKTILKRTGQALADGKSRPGR
ncbi:MAG TPA: hypothetical protein VJ476_10415 [Rhizomicrobium sp.]|nr:hypothetical protein [Rhizomicrobium sp.]